MKTTKTLAWAIVDSKGKIKIDKWKGQFYIYKKEKIARNGWVIDQKVARVEIIIKK